MALTIAPEARHGDIRILRSAPRAHKDRFDHPTDMVGEPMRDAVSLH